MKVFSVLLLSVILFGCYPTTAPLFPYQDNGKTGYIDSQGNVIITARFAAAQEFAEELAAVRQDGYYGYIDKSGKYIIDPTFDYATPFSQGIALVYKGSLAQYIDKSGHTLTPVFAAGEVFTNGTAIVTNFRGKNGLIDATGKLILDTTYQHISREQNGLIYAADSTGTSQLLDKNGHLLPLHKTYPVLYPLGDNYIIGMLETSMDSINNNVVLDLSGKEIMRYNNHSVYPLDISDEKIFLAEMLSSSERRVVLYDLKRKDTLLNNIEDYTLFNNHRALIRTKDDSVMLVSSEGNITPTPFKSFQKQGFQDGFAFVLTKEGYGLIDTTGKFIINPQYDRISPYGRTASAFLFGKMDYGPYGLIGMADRTGKTLVAPTLQSMDQRGFVNGLMKCVKDSLSTYLDTNGKVIWQEKKAVAFPPMNIDYAREGNYYVKEDDGWGFVKSFHSVPPYEYYAILQPVKQQDRLLSKSLIVRVDTTNSKNFQKQFKGYQINILNNTDTSILFPIQDYKLSLAMMAFVNNQWIDIEQFPIYDCMHPTTNFQLIAGYSWELFCPQYEGAKQVRLRMVLRYCISTTTEYGEVYSNEFSGGINPGQLWRRQENKDPYKVSVFQL